MCATGKKKEESMGEKERNMETTVKTTISAIDSVTIKEAVRLIEAATPSGLRIASISGEVFFADGKVHVGAGSISVTFEPDALNEQLEKSHV